MQINLIKNLEFFNINNSIQKDHLISFLLNIYLIFFPYSLFIFKLFRFFLRIRI